MNSGWNFRVVRRSRDGFEHFAVHEVYYDHRGLPNAVTTDPVDVRGYSLDDAKGCYEMMAEAFEKPVLDFDKIPDEEAEPLISEDTRKEIEETAQGD